MEQHRPGDRAVGGHDDSGSLGPVEQEGDPGADRSLVDERNRILGGVSREEEPALREVDDGAVVRVAGEEVQLDLQASQIEPEHSLEGDRCRAQRDVGEVRLVLAPLGGEGAAPLPPLA